MYRFPNRPQLSYSSLLLIAILVLAAVLRFYKISQPLVDEFAWREASTAMMAENFFRNNTNILFPEVNWSGVGPGYQGRELQTVSYISSILFHVFGQHDWIGRSVVIAFGLWGIFALYKLVSLAWGDKYALAAAGVMAVLPGAVFVDRSFLPDSAMVSLVVTSAWMMLAYCQNDRRIYLLLAILMGALGFLAKLPGLIIGIPILYSSVATLRFRNLLRPQRLLIIGISALIVLAPVVLYYLWARHLAMAYSSRHFAGEDNWIWDQGLGAWLQMQYFLPALFQNMVGWLWGWAASCLLLIGVMISPPSRRTTMGIDLVEHATLKPHSSGTAPWIFHYWLLAFFIYYLIGAKQLTTNIWNLHLINPAAAAFIGLALIAIYEKIKVNSNTNAAFSSMISLFMAIAIIGRAAIAPYYLPSYQNFHDIGRALASRSAPEDLVVSFGLEPIGLYYAGRRGWVFPPAHRWDGSGIWISDRKAIIALEELRSQGADWLMMPNAWEWFHLGSLRAYHPALMEYIETSCISIEDLPSGALCRLKK